MVIFKTKIYLNTYSLVSDISKISKKLLFETKTFVSKSLLINIDENVCIQYTYNLYTNFVFFLQ